MYTTSVVGSRFMWVLEQGEVIMDAFESHTYTSGPHPGYSEKKQTVIDSVPYLVYLRVSRGLLTPRPCKNGSASHTWTSDLKQQTPKAMAKMSLWIRSKFLTRI